MYRTAMKDLYIWKDRPTRKPLILQGARQVGKTWLAQEFGREAFDNTAYVSFQDNDSLKAVFEGSLQPERLLDALTAECGTVAGGSDTLIILDEIQDCPKALAALKQFYEQRPEIPIIAAGSLLGVALHAGISFPVGKVEHLSIHPLSFYEFLLAKKKEALASFLEDANYDMIDAFSERYEDALREYYFVGGMPEAVEAYIQTGDFATARRIQNNLLYDYDHDFSKYAGGTTAERIRKIWKSVPSQLARENKKFKYNDIGKGARARNFEEAISWLVDAGLCTKVDRISKPGIPLSSYADGSAFKLFFLDVGLLGAACGLSSATIFGSDSLFAEFKGALSEQYVCQQLVSTNVITPYYWTAKNSSGEIDFIYDFKGKVFPLEVKAARNVRARSLRAFIDRYKIPDAIRLSLMPYKRQGDLVNIPLYATSVLPWLEN